MKLKRKTASGIILMLLIMAVSTSMFNFHLVKATPTDLVTIKADGSVYPPTAPIDQDGDTYTFNGSITYPTYYGILVNKGNIVINGAGHVVEGNETGNGFELDGVSNVTIKNTNIKSFENGIYLISASNNTISGNNITNNNYGIRLYSSSNNNSISGNNITNNNYGIRLHYYSNYNGISGNNITNNNYGIVLESSSNNSISGNNITNNDFGIRLLFSSNNALYENVLNGNRYNLHVGGYELSHFIQSINVSNFVEGKPVYYLVNQTDLLINASTQVGFLGLINCGNVTAKGLTLTGNRQGLLLAFTNNSTITDNTITNNYFGIWLLSSSNNTISGNNITNNNYGIRLYSSSNNNSISGNNITNNNYGIYHGSSLNSGIYENHITNNGYGIVLESSSNNNIISRNNITTNNNDGIRLLFSSNNMISGNNITNNEVGIELEESSNNKLHHNNLIENTQQVYDYSWDHPGYSNSINSWDDGYPSGGNYWSNYDGVDANEDGIGDTPHTIDANNKDNYPLMEPYSPPPPYYKLTVTSSPITGITFTINEDQQKTPYIEWVPEGSYTLEMPETHDGYNWSHWLEDGNTDTTRIKSVTMDRSITLTGVFADITPPTISIIFPGNKTYTKSDVPLFFTVSESTSWMGYSLDSQMNVTINGNTTIGDLPDGIHTLTVYANDTAGNMGSSETVYFTVDTSIPDTFPPTVWILSPKNKTYTTTDIPLTVIVDENVTWMAYSLDDQANMTFSETTTLSGLSNGLHRLIAYANDTAGNMGASETVYFTVDTVPPNIEILSPENKTYTTSSVSLTFTLNEPISWIGYSLDGQANVTIAGNTTLSDLPDGSHSLIVYANDTFGNIGASEIIYFSIDTQQRPEPFPMWIVAVIVIIAAFGTAVYLLKIRRKS